MDGAKTNSQEKHAAQSSTGLGFVLSSPSFVSCPNCLCKTPLPVLFPISFHVPRAVDASRFDTSFNTTIVGNTGDIVNSEDHRIEGSSCFTAESQLDPTCP